MDDAPRAMKKIPKSFCVRACVYPSRDDPALFVAHSLELDVVGVGASVEEALDELLEVIESQIESCEHNDAQLQFFAPASVWQMYDQAKRAGRRIKDELISRVIRHANQRLGHTVTGRFDTIMGTSQVPQTCLQA